MKLLFFTGCTLIILISMACRKDSVNNVTHICIDCKIDTPSVQHWSAIYVTDSNWVGQGQHVLKSDLTQLINEAGASVSEVYALQFVNEGMLFQFFPCCQINCHGGELSGAVYSTGNNKTCTLTFTYSDQDVQSGELPNPGFVPFQSVVIKVWLWK
jgi:hypothetical protein